MKRILSAVIPAILLVGLFCTNPFKVHAKEVTQVPKTTLLEDFEGEAFIMAEEGMDLLGMTLEPSNKAKNSGTYSMMLSHTGQLGGDPISEMKINFAGKGVDFTTVTYMDMWVKNDTDMVLGLTWLRLNDLVCCEKSYIQNASGAFVENLTFKAGADGAYTDANGTAWKKVWGNNPVVAIPANYTGWLRLELSGAGKHASTDHMDLGFVPSADGRHVLYIDDITLVHSTTVDKYLAPTGLDVVSPTEDTAADGKITGVTDEMEYRAEGSTAYTAITGTEVTGLAAGKYFVRYKATSVVLAGEDAVVTVPGYVAPPLDDYLRMVNNFNTAAKAAEAQGKEYPFLAGTEFEVGKMPGKNSNSLMMNFKEDTLNPLQKVLVSTKTGDLTHADFIQIQIDWTSEFDLWIRPALADAAMGNAAWYYKMVDENPGWEDSDTGKFWKDYILIKGNASAVVGVTCTSVSLYNEGQWTYATADGEFYKIPAGYKGYIRFDLPSSVKKEDRDGVCFEFKNGEEGFAGIMYIDDLMIGIEQAVSAAYPYAFNEYIKNETELKDAEEPGGPNESGEPGESGAASAPSDNSDEKNNPGTGHASAAGIAALGVLAALCAYLVSLQKKKSLDR